MLLQTLQKQWAIQTADFQKYAEMVSRNAED